MRLREAWRQVHEGGGERAHRAREAIYAARDVGEANQLEGNRVEAARGFATELMLNKDIRGSGQALKGRGCSSSLRRLGTWPALIPRSSAGSSGRP